MTSEITALVHIEVVTEDPDAAATFMEEVFGAQRAEPEFSRFCEGYKEDSGSRVVHVRAGTTIFQFIRPSGSGSWREQLDTSGPGVHNITLEVANLDDARAEMLARGCASCSPSAPTSEPRGTSRTPTQSGTPSTRRSRSGCASRWCRWRRTTNPATDALSGLTETD